MLKRGREGSDLNQFESDRAKSIRTNPLQSAPSSSAQIGWCLPPIDIKGVRGYKEVVELQSNDLIGKHRLSLPL